MENKKKNNPLSDFVWWAYKWKLGIKLSVWKWVSPFSISFVVAMTQKRCRYTLKSGVPTDWLSWSMTSNLYSPWKQHVLHRYADFMAENRLNEKSCDDIATAFRAQLGMTQCYSDRKVWRWWQSRDLSETFAFVSRWLLISRTHICISKKNAHLNHTIHLQHIEH